MDIKSVNEIFDVSWYIHFVEMNEIVYFFVWAAERAYPMAAEKTAEINFAFYPQSKKRRGVESFR